MTVLTSFAVVVWPAGRLCDNQLAVTQTDCWFFRRELSDGRRAGRSGLVLRMKRSRYACTPPPEERDGRGMIVYDTGWDAGRQLGLRRRATCA